MARLTSILYKVWGGAVQLLLMFVLAPFSWLGEQLGYLLYELRELREKRDAEVRRLTEEVIAECERVIPGMAAEVARCYEILSRHTR